MTPAVSWAAGWCSTEPPPKRIDDYRRTLNDALDCLPDRAGTSWRGIILSAPEQAEYVPGRTVTRAVFLSSSRREDKAFKRNMRFTIRGRHGKDIRPYSAFPIEDEVLFRAGTQLRVVSRRDDAGLLKIEVEEVDDG